MPTPEKFLSSIQASFLELQKHGYAELSRSPQLAGTRGKRSILISQNPVGLQADHSSAAEYLYVRSNRLQNLVFVDEALLQVEMSFDGNAIAWYRYVYSRCPFNSTIFDCADVDELLALDLRYQLDGSDTRLFLNSPVWRFEYDPDSDSAYHPGSHVHIGGAAFRTGVDRVLGPGTFMRFVLETFYNGSWQFVEPHWRSFEADRRLNLAEVDKHRLYVTGA